jgi:hypothetical protein
MVTKKLMICQGCGSKMWVDQTTMIMPKHRKGDPERSRCPMSQKKIGAKK